MLAKTITERSLSRSFLFLTFWGEQLLHKTTLKCLFRIFWLCVCSLQFSLTSFFPPSLFLCLSWPVKWWSPWRWQRQWSDLRSSTEMPPEFAECAVTRRLASISMRWHVKAAKVSSGRSLELKVLFFFLSDKKHHICDLIWSCKLSRYLFKLSSLSLFTCLTRNI